MACVEGVERAGNDKARGWRIADASIGMDMAPEAISRQDLAQGIGCGIRLFLQILIGLIEQKLQQMG
jgi:hypothetical protein